MGAKFMGTAMFEYGVILNGSQTMGAKFMGTATFEYGVILNGSQTTVFGTLGKNDELI